MLNWKCSRISRREAGPMHWYMWLFVEGSCCSSAGAGCLPGCTSLGGHHGFKVVPGPGAASSGLRLSAPRYPRSFGIQKSEINLSSESQGLLLFLANLLSYMTVMPDNYMRQVTVQTVKIKLLPGIRSSIMKHNLNYDNNNHLVMGSFSPLVHVAERCAGCYEEQQL